MLIFSHKTVYIYTFLLILIMYYIYRVRVPAKHVYYYKCPDHRKNYVMSFAFCFDREDDVYQFSYCYPYSYTRLQNYLDGIEKKEYDYFNRELLCLSVVSSHGDCLVAIVTKWHSHQYDNKHIEWFPKLDTGSVVMVTKKCHYTCRAALQKRRSTMFFLIH